MPVTNLATLDEIDRLKGAARARDRRQRRQPEKSFTSGLKRYAVRGGWLVYHTLRSKGSDPGFPDIIAIRANRIVIAELKVPPNTRPSDWQACWLLAFRILQMLAGPWLSIETYVWTPADWPEIEEVLK